MLQHARWENASEMEESVQEEKATFSGVLSSLPGSTNISALQGRLLLTINCIPLTRKHFHYKNNHTERYWICCYGITTKTHKTPWASFFFRLDFERMSSIFQLRYFSEAFKDVRRHFCTVRWEVAAWILRTSSSSDFQGWSALSEQQFWFLCFLSVERCVSTCPLVSAES